MALPRIDPLLPLLARDVPRGREWLYELKLDGFRGTLYIENGMGRFFSKTRRPLPRFQALAAALARALPVREAIFDGEVIVMNARGPDFRALLFGSGEPSYAAFDLLWLDGKDLRRQPLWRRKRTLARVLRDTPVAVVESTDDPRLFDAAASMDLEGIVAKRRADPYAAGTRWVKIKYPAYSQNEGRWEWFDRRRR